MLYLDDKSVQLFLDSSHASVELTNLVKQGFTALMHYRYQLIHVKTLLNLINGDNEAYNFAPHPAPYAARSYQTIDDYMATDCICEEYRQEVMKKLENEK